MSGTQESGNFIPSFSSEHLVPENGHMVDAEEEDIIKWAGGALYFGGADTVRMLRSIVHRLTDDNLNFRPSHQSCHSSC